MAKRKRKRKPHSGNNDLALSYRVDKLPRKRVSKKVFFRRLIRFITHGEGLPESWEVTLRWRNSPKSEWREGEFQEAVNDSREGFNKVVLGRLRRDAKQ